MTQLGFYFNAAECVGCKSCSVACKENYHLASNMLMRRVYNYVGGSWDPTEAGFYTPNGVFGYYVNIACNHCADPACVANCPVGAMTKDPETGIVSNDRSICIGCRTCITVCPYSAPTFCEAEGVTYKCDFCKDELAKERLPYCVATCPSRALDCGDIDELRAKYGDGVCEIEPLPLQTTNPSIIINPHPAAQASGTGTGYEVSLAEELSL